MNRFLTFAGFAAFALLAGTGQAQSTKKTPYWASISEPEARMRSGPSEDYPVRWVYKRKFLPVKVIAVREIWRKVEDPDGAQGWIYVGLLSPNRTALVIGSGIGSLRESPEPSARVAWRVEPGVVGLIDECQKGWCRLDVSGRTGYIETSRLWGDEPL
jgi:SH3-like domain-containing protein